MKKFALVLVLAGCAKAAAPTPAAEVSSDSAEVAQDAPVAVSPADAVSPAEPASPVTP